MAMFERKHEGFNAEHKEEPFQSSPEQSYVERDVAHEKKLVRKVDKRLLPILGALYSIALIDRVNVSQSGATDTTKFPNGHPDLSGSYLRHG